MSPLLFAATALAGGAGATARYLADRWLAPRLPAGFPWPIAAVNVSGSFLLGLLTGLLAAGPWLTVLGVGLLGGYTTFSTVSADAARLFSERRHLAAAANALGTLLACTAAAAAGLLLGRLA
ncbi:fluoride efflux transporter FluC [Zafaria sp. J156]|uniref:fluoride efflux transporter FluC n=1 Tax=Zafaria sp. J156 TaxID=3116490 RepID=UPI002E78AA02|nr:CrcB family protein [Zafaria sp. J156]MEE1620908.1 CrcB family protein [Zafaria sp. J156]